MSLRHPIGIKAIRHSIGKNLGFLYGSGGGEELTWLLYDEFTTADAAPITSPRTCEPGPGTLTITDTDNVLSIVDGSIVKASGGTSAYQNASALSGAIAESGNAGIAFFDKYTPVAITTIPISGWGNTLPTSLSAPDAAFEQRNSFRDDSGGIDPGVPYTLNTENSFLMVDRSVGIFFISDGILYWVSTVDRTPASNNKIYISNYTNTNQWKHDTIGVLSLPANGYTAWDADFSTVTDSESSPSLKEIDVEADCHIRCTFTQEAGQSVAVSFRFTDASNRILLQSFNNSLSMYKRVAGSFDSLGSGPALTDGVTYQLDVVAYGSSIKVYLDNVLTYDVTETAWQTVSGGYVYNDLATNDIELSTHPYPALGIATDRVIAPQLNDTGQSSTSGLMYIRGITLPTAAGDQQRICFRKDLVGGAREYVHPLGDGSVTVRNRVGGIGISAGAGTISDGDDLCMIWEGTDGELFVNGTSVGSSSIYDLTTDDDWSVDTFQAGSAIDSIEFFPRDVSSLLPSELV